MVQRGALVERGALGRCRRLGWAESDERAEWRRRRGSRGRCFDRWLSFVVGVDDAEEGWRERGGGPGSAAEFAWESTGRPVRGVGQEGSAVEGVGEAVDGGCRDGRTFDVLTGGGVVQAEAFLGIGEELVQPWDDPGSTASGGGEHCDRRCLLMTG